MIPPIYCICFLEEPWKRLRVHDHCTKIGLIPTYIDGVNGQSLGIKSVNPFDVDEHGKEQFVHPTQIGRIISHRIALSTALASSSGEFIVCEDDVCFTTNFVSMWEGFRAALPRDASVVQLSFLKDDVKLIPVNDNVAKTEPYPFLSTCTWWRSDAAHKAITMLWAFDRPYDIMLIQRVYPYLNHYVATPQMASIYRTNS